MQHSIINKLISGPLRWLLHNNISYWHKQAFRFKADDQDYTLEPATRCGAVVILARNHYQEFVHAYPVTQLSELKQILKTEYPQQGVLHYIGPEQDQRRTVCSFVIQDALLQQFNGLKLLLPESLLLWQALKPEAAVYQCDSGSGYFLYTAATVPVSQQLNVFCHNMAAFSLNNGIPDLVEHKHLDQQNYVNKLVSALSEAVLAIGKVALLTKPAINTSTWPLKPIAYTVAGVLLTYGALVSVYYNLMLDKRQSQLTALGANVNQLLDLQTQLQQLKSDADTLVQLRQDKQATAHIWQVLIPLLQHDSSIQLQNISSQDGSYILRGNANQATAVLTALQTSSLIIDARFDAPVRRDRELDAFVISLRLSQQPAQAVEVTNVAE